MGKRRLRGERIKIPILWGLLACSCMIGAIVLINQANKRFSEGTQINGVDCSNLTVEQTIEKLENAEITIRFSEEVTYTITSSELGRTITKAEAVQSLLSKQKSTEGKELKIFILPTTIYDTETGTDQNVYSVDEEKMEAYLRNLPELKPENMQESQDAYIVQTDEGALRIIPEVYGGKIEISEALDFAYTQLIWGNNRINFEVITDKPEVTKDNPELVSTRNTINGILLTTINYELAEGNAYTLNLEIMKDWVYQDEEGKFNLDLEEHADSVVDELAKEVERIGLYRTVTTKTGTYTLPVAYGYRDALDKEAEKAQLLEELEAGGLYNRRPCYSRFNDLENPNTYIESSISEQRTWMYVDEEEILDAPHISGTKGVNDSPTGIFYSNSKERDKILRMFGICHVDSWVTIYNNVGYHDASEWRADSEYTPDRYTWDGSHGCFNLMKEDSLTIHDNIELYVTPIIIHD